MKNLLYILIIIFFQKILLAQTTPSLISESNYKQIDTLSNDLILVKPLINFNDSNGGYYSQYYHSGFQSMYCGAIVQNIGSLSSTNVYLELNFLDYSNSIISTYYSDTIPILNSNQVDTLRIQQIITSGDWNYKIFYNIKSNENDENENNNSDTLPDITLYDDMWSEVSRSSVPTSTLDINQIPNFHSGDFIGITLKFPYMWHSIAAFGIYCTEICPYSVIMISKIYQNGILIASSQISPWQDWTYTYDYLINGMNFIMPDSTYYIGVELIYPNGINIPIGIDTSTFHNFESETIARIGNTWTTLNFVPLIKIVCDPEQIQTIENCDQIKIFPNPNNGVVNINNVENSEIEIYDLIGKLLVSNYSATYNKSINLSMLSEGNYIVRIVNNRGTVYKKINIIK